MIFVDASALVAICKAEPERPALLDRLVDHDRALWSPMACWETVSALAHSYRLPIAAALAEVRHTAARLRLEMVAIAQDELDAALDAYQRYGKQSRHPARLNMGDCFAYACAKTHAAALLYKGDDFSHTDLA